LTAQSASGFVSAGGEFLGVSGCKRARDYGRALTMPHAFSSAFLSFDACFWRKSMSSIIRKIGIAALLAGVVFAHGSLAQDVPLLDGVTTRAENNPSVEEGKYKKDAPWVIGMSSFGVNANTWTVQVAHEAQAAADRDKRITKFVLLDAGFDQKKQVADSRSPRRLPMPVSRRP
jgi:hypothetical protein